MEMTRRLLAEESELNQIVNTASSRGRRCKAVWKKHWPIFPFSKAVYFNEVSAEL